MLLLRRHCYSRDRIGMWMGIGRGKGIPVSVPMGRDREGMGNRMEFGIGGGYG
jgi:hypothetical protein